MSERETVVEQPPENRIVTTRDSKQIEASEAKSPAPKTPREIPAGFGEPEVSFLALWRILQRRKRVIFVVAGTIFGAALLYTLLATPRYLAVATIEFNKQNSDALEVDEERALINEADSSDYSVMQQTQVKVLESDTLALQVIKELDLEKRPEFSKKQLFSVDFFHHYPDESALPLEQAPFRRMNILKTFHKNLAVEPIAGTRMISVQFLNPDAQVSAAVTNRLLSDFKEQTFQNRYAATIESSSWLAGQLDDLRKQVQDAEQHLVDYQRQAGFLGTDESHNIVMTRLEESNRELMQAESNRILAQTVVQLVRNGNPELVSGFVNPTTSSIFQEAVTSLGALRAQKQQLELQYAEASVKYGSAYPRLVELQKQLNQADQGIQAEVDRIRARAESEYVAAEKNEMAMRAAFEDEKDAANKLNDSAVQYTILKHDVESSHTLYDTLLAKVKETGLIAGLRSTNIVVVDPARPADRPARPNVPLNLAAGLFVGLLLGVASAFVAENLDDTINTPDDAEQVTLLPSLGTVPHWKRKPRAKDQKSNSLAKKEVGVMVVSRPHSHPAEAFRTLRTSIMQSIRPNIPTAFLVTSPVPGEGKTTVSLNCSAAFAQQGARVLLVEADLRRPRLRNELKLTTSAGLTSLMQGLGNTELPIKLPSLPRLAVIPAGPPSEYPADLLGSERMKALLTKWRTEYEYIFFDTAPILSVTDSMVLASICDLVILVAKSRTTKKQSLCQARKMLFKVRPRVLGVVVNGFDPDSPDYLSYYGYGSADAAAGYYEPVAK